MDRKRDAYGRKCCIHDDHDDNKQNEINYNSLSEDLIRQICSNLNLMDIINFEQCDKITFNSIRSKPLSVASVYLYSSYISKYYHNQNILLRNRFKYVRNIEIETEDTHIINWFQWNNLHKISFFGDPSKKIKLRDTINLLKVTHVNLHTVSDDSINILTKCINTEHLSTYYVINIKYIQLILNSLKNIKALRVVNIDMVHFYQKQLESLHIFCSGINFNNLCFDNLKELCLYWEDDQNIEHLSKVFGKCSKLERFHLSLDSYELIDNDYSFFYEIFSLKTINFISISFSFSDQFIRCIKTLNESLLKRKKKRMKIRMAVHIIFNDEPKLYIDTLLTLILTLNKRTKNWMILLEELEINHQWREILSQQSNNKYLVKSNDSKQLIISNPNCFINGYRERWLYPCDICEECET